MSIALDQLIEQVKALPPIERQLVRQALAETESEVAHPTPEEEFQNRLVQCGLLAAPKKPKRDQAAFDRFVPVPIQGKPLSETIIEERR